MIDKRTTLDLVGRAFRACDVRDVLLPASLAALLYGVAQWSGPAAWVLAGLLGLSAWLRPHLRRRTS